MEQWKEIVNFEGIYEVSSLGQVRRIIEVLNIKYYLKIL